MSRPDEGLTRLGTRDGGDDDPRLAQFLRGVTMGALVGAAIAGSAIWRRRMARSADLAALPSPDVIAGPAVPTGQATDEATGLPTGQPAGQRTLAAPSASERATSG